MELSLLLVGTNIWVGDVFDAFRDALNRVI